MNYPVSMLLKLLALWAGLGPALLVRADSAGSPPAALGVQLAQVGSKDAGASLDALRHLATSAEPSALREAGPALVEAVLPVISDREVEGMRRALAFDVLSRAGLAGRAAAPAALDTFGRVNDSLAAAAAGRFLATLGESEPGSGRVVVELLEKIDFMDPIHRRALVEVVRRQGPPLLERIPQILQLTRHTSHYVDVLINLRSAIAGYGEPAIPYLVPLLRDSDALVRLETIQVLSDMASVRMDAVDALRERVLPTVRTMLADPDAEVAGAAGSFVRLLAALAAARSPSG